MTTRIGIELRESEICAVMVRRGVLRWHARAPLSGLHELSDCMDTLLASAPRRRLLRRQLHVALGPGRSQVKRLEGLPSVDHRSELTRFLRENAESLFLRTSSAMAIPDVHVNADGASWGAALDCAAVMTVVAAARRHRAHVRLVLPTVAAFGWQVRSTRFVLSDADHHVELTTDGSELLSVRRVREAAPPPPLPAALQALGEDALDYVGAFAAATSTGRAPLSWIPGESPGRASGMRRARLVASSVALALACAAAASAPAVRAAAFIHRETTSAMRARTIELEAARAESELRRTALVLSAVDAFDSRRGQIPRMLGQLSQTLPESTALVSFRIDSIEGSFVAVAPHVTDLLNELTAVDEITAVKLVGSVTREMLGGVRVERATVRFRRPHVGSRR
jgi:hypothetical protein